MYRNHLVAMNRLIITGIGIRLVKKGREGKKGDRAKFSWTNHLNFFKGNATPFINRFITCTEILVTFSPAYEYTPEYCDIAINLALFIG